MNAYMFFANTERSKTKLENPEMNNKDIIKNIGEKWRGMDDDEKQPYKDKAEDDKWRYKKEKNDYEKAHPFTNENSESTRGDMTKTKKAKAHIKKKKPKKTTKTKNDCF